MAARSAPLEPAAVSARSPQQQQQRLAKRNLPPQPSSQSEWQPGRPKRRSLLVWGRGGGAAGAGGPAGIIRGNLTAPRSLPVKEVKGLQPSAPRSSHGALLDLSVQVAGGGAGGCGVGGGEAYANLEHGLGIGG